MFQYSKPQDLANLVFNKLKFNKSGLPTPELYILEKLFECLFFSSMCKEESELVRVTITFIDPSNPDPSPPKHLVPERWSWIPFETSIPLSTKSLAKLSKAADPQSSSLAIYFDERGDLFIWGMIDQAMHYQNFLNYESDNHSEQPGRFQVSINDIGTLNVLFDYELLATLKQNVLVKRYLDVLTIGPISKILRKNAEFLKTTVQDYLKNVYPQEDFSEWEDFLDGLWIQTFSRLLLKIQNYQHGGALLLSEVSGDLDIKYRIHYERLTLAMVSYAKAVIDNSVGASAIKNNFVLGKKTLGKNTYLREVASTHLKEGTADEISGAISFIASQSCVDGVVLFNKSMVANGFGAVLKSKKMPSKIYVSSTATATPKSLSMHDPGHYGTRHRSMIAYCWKHPESLGFVISQDGEIRAFCKIDDKLIMWENIKTQHYINNKRRNI
ncbi:putative sensor domain DACNV-containing protein [Pedobacter aquatilis]|uniref:putative sensor domain DACNV-containing protein n=1 Tax=Pedobacter aquatilis TaxID=351343 RepID=UPI00292F94E2|nr:hypothetical protein [Pedobacter aquatilis]